jgi:hypothetical protein
MKTPIAVLAGITTTALLFPTRGETGCPGGNGHGGCESWSESLLLRYRGENGAVGMAIALAAGGEVAFVVYFLAGRLGDRKR